jgi:L-amino acid N-acyltransferase YncA
MESIITFKELESSDYEFIAAIYNYYVIHSTATFHLELQTLEQIITALPKNNPVYKTWIILYQNELCGYCYLNNWKPREAYRRSAEVTLYIKQEFHGKGIGRETLNFIEQQAQQSGISNLLGVITAENLASIHLFKSMGYSEVGLLKNIGEKFGRLLDVTTYQKQIINSVH